MAHAYASYNPAHALLVLFELAGNMAFMVFAALLIWLFFQRRTSVPCLLIAFYSLNFLFIFFDNALAVMLKISEAEFKQIFQAMVSAAIWIPYVIKSKRVQSTFTERLPLPETVLVVPEEETSEENKALITLNNKLFYV